MKLAFVCSLAVGACTAVAAPANPSPAPGAGATPHAATLPATQPSAPDPREQAYLSDVVQLTDGFDRAGEGYFSRDMKQIIFQATPKGEKHYQMYVAPLQVSTELHPPGQTVAFRSKVTGIGHPFRISPDNSRNTCGYFSPDGRHVIFGSTAGKEKPEEPGAGFQRQGGNYRWDFPDGMEIYRADAQRALAGLDSVDRVDLARPENRLTNNDAYDAEGAYSPDGKWICFTSRRSGDSEIWVMRADGSNPVQITKNKGYDGGPFFSPDGKRLVYRSDRRDNSQLQVFVADLAFDEAGNVTGLKKEHTVTDDEQVNWGPYWHPDGEHLIFATSRHGHANYELYAIRTDGTHPVRITYAPGFDGLPVFSPDGKFLMWSGKRSRDGTTQLFLAKFTPPKDW